jgi:hypothetical protein
MTYNPKQWDVVFISHHLPGQRLRLARGEGREGKEVAPPSGD